MSSPVLSVGVLGCGRLAAGVHLPILQRMPGVRVAAVSEADPGRREEARKSCPDARCSADYRELLGMEELDAVVICLPTGMHREAAVASLQANKHVYLEKPLATSEDDAEAVLAEWRAGDRNRRMQSLQRADRKSGAAG